jgi:hypothetical protein
MHLTINNNSKNLIITLLCLVVAYWIQINTFLNWDVAWHVEGARRLLAGGDYLSNLFDNNSPFVFAYYIPVIVLHRALPLFYPHLVILYILLTSIIPLALCYSLIHKAFKQKEIVVMNLLYYTVLFIIVFLPAFNFGHREIVLIYCYLPYFLFLTFLTTYPETFTLDRTWWVYPIVLLAAYGISQNILYISIVIFLDFYRFLKTRQFNFFQGFFYGCILFNIWLIAFLYPNYIKHIIPMVLCYESGFNFPLLVLILQMLMFISLLTVTIVLVNIRRLYKSDDLIMCFIAAICSLLIYFFELKLWYYHIYPALCFVMLILTLLVTKYYEENFLDVCILPRVNLFSAAIAAAMLITIVFVVFNFSKGEWQDFHNPNDENHQWINYARRHFANKKLFFFVIKLGPAYAPLFYSEANIHVVSPWSNPWMLPYIIEEKGDGSLFCNLADDISLFTQLTTRAMANEKPDFIIVEKAPEHLLFQGKQFEYITFFSRDNNFTKIFKNYRIYGYYDSFTIYTKRS